MPLRENQTFTDLRATILCHVLHPISLWGKTVHSCARFCVNSRTSQRNRVPENGKFPFGKRGVKATQNGKPQFGACLPPVFFNYYIHIRMFWNYQTEPKGGENGGGVTAPKFCGFGLEFSQMFWDGGVFHVSWAVQHQSETPYAQSLNVRVTKQTSAECEVQPES